MLKEVRVRSQIRSSSTVIWYRDKSLDYISNGYWVIKTDLRNRYRKILSGLVEMFGTIPSENETLRLNKYPRKENSIQKYCTKPDWLEFLDTSKTGNIKNTRLMYSENAFTEPMKIFKGEGYIYINSKYLEMVDVGSWDIHYKGDKPMNPIFVENSQDLIMLLPIRVHEDSGYLRKEKEPIADQAN